MLKVISFSLSMIVFGSAISFASCHVSNCPDQDFIDLAQKYPSVGCFSTQEGIVGSGTLVDVGPEELKGRVVVTCAHMFIDADAEKFLFTVGDSKPCGGKYYVHPKYEEDDHEGTKICNDSFDIGVFILNEGLSNAALSCLDFETPYTDLLESNFVSVGFGHAGHVLGKHRIIDGSKRASYAHAHACDNPSQDQDIALTIVSKAGEKTKTSFVIKKHATLMLTPYVFSREVDERNTLETFQNPSGVARSGDSGGGCFWVESDKLTGVISGGSDDLHALQYVMERHYFLKYQKALEEMVDEACIRYESELCDLKLTHPEKVEAFLIENVQPKMPDVIEAHEMDALMKERYERNSFIPAEKEQQRFQMVDQRVVLVSFHKDWIMSVLSKVLEG
jgi:hypothetical protein